MLAHGLPRRARLALHAAGPDSDRAATVISGAQVDSEALGPTPGRVAGGGHPVEPAVRVPCSCSSAPCWGRDHLADPAGRGGWSVTSSRPRGWAQSDQCQQSQRAELAHGGRLLPRTGPTGWGCCACDNADLTPTTLAVPDLGAAPRRSSTCCAGGGSSWSRTTRARRGSLGRGGPGGRGRRADRCDAGPAHPAARRPDRRPAGDVRGARRPGLHLGGPRRRGGGRALDWLIAHLDANLRDLPLAPRGHRLHRQPQRRHGRQPFHPATAARTAGSSVSTSCATCAGPAPGRASARSRTIG
ncbi:hypothetical protein LT493_16355 [Streptomyces tricolor]|nr:hypothetical protein [Streptomyces tricolor]